jgi:hypothetical protein
LEKQMQFYKRLVVVLALVIVAGVSMRQTSSDIVDVLKCRKLEVYSPDGKVMAGLMAGYLSLFNNGKITAILTAGDDGGQLAIYQCRHGRAVDNLS